MFQVDKWRHQLLLAVRWTCQVSLDKVHDCYHFVTYSTVLFKVMQANFDKIPAFSWLFEEFFLEVIFQ